MQTDIDDLQEDQTLPGKNFQNLEPVIVTNQVGFHDVLSNGHFVRLMLGFEKTTNEPMYVLTCGKEGPTPDETAMISMALGQEAMQMIAIRYLNLANHLNEGTLYDTAPTKEDSRGDEQSSGNTDNFQ